MELSQLRKRSDPWLKSRSYRSRRTPSLCGIPHYPFLKKGQSDVDFCVEMAQKIGVGAVPGSSFFDEDVNHIIRLHFAKKDETLNTALERLSHLKDLAR